MSLWRRHLTFMVIPSADQRPWRVSMSLPFVIFLLTAWGLLTAWVILVGSRELEYRGTRAENQTMRTRLSSLLDEMSRSRGELEAAKDADKEIRALLRLPLPGEAGRAAEPDRAPRRPAPRIAAAEPAGAGGAGWAERQALRRGFLRAQPGETAPLAGGFEELRRLSRERIASFKEISAHLDWRRRLLQATPRGWPAAGRITSRYGYRFSPLSRDDEVESREFHPGLDIANAKGTIIRATADGVVVRARWSGGYGQLVLIRHDLGYATLYGHASRLFVKAGQKVERGQAVAAEGSTGRSTGNHLHYEVWWKGKPINPARFLKDPTKD